ncbi:MAG: HAD-IIA family hydrolase [Magnetococcales bacterium]|nr:HAD-IIA family hydrolase [Magnetococcales bacterium]
MSFKPILPEARALQALSRRYRQRLVAEQPALEERLRGGRVLHTSRFLTLAAGYDCILFDAYGVLNRGPTPIPGAVQTLAALRRENKSFFLVSNNACLSPPQIMEQLRGMGFALDAEQLVTSGMAVRPAVARSRFRDRPYCLVGTQAGALAYAPQPEKLMVNFSPKGGCPTDQSGQEAEYILLCSDVEYHGGPQQRLVESLLSERTRPLLVANPDFVAPDSCGNNLWVSGLTAADLEKRFAAPWIGLGKPFSPVFDLVLERMGKVPRNRILMVGDTLETDILGGAAMGFDTCLTLSGVLSGHAGSVTTLCDQLGIRPDHVVPSIADP